MISNNKGKASLASHSSSISGYRPGTVSKVLHSRMVIGTGILFLVLAVGLHGCFRIDPHTQTTIEGDCWVDPLILFLPSLFCLKYTSKTYCAQVNRVARHTPTVVKSVFYLCRRKRSLTRLLLLYLGPGRSCCPVPSRASPLSTR